MQIYCGTDITLVSRIKDAISRNEEAFLKRTFTQNEIDHCYSKKNEDARFESLAARFAAKEAAGKALGTGIMAKGIVLTDIETLIDEGGRPYLDLKGQAKARAESLGIVSMSLSLAHDGGLAIAYVTMLGSEDEEEQR
ncbi:MAG: holo-ACP synthase [Saccharofermentans sp.]|nr:holo-ACP synthase [Saccharofermentans sp.]